MATVPSIGPGGERPTLLTPVGWLAGLLWPTIGGLLSIGVIVGLHWLWPRLPPSTGAGVWGIAFAAPTFRWYTRPVRDRRFAACCAGLVLLALYCGLGVRFWRSPVIDDWRWLAIQTGALWLTTLTF